MTSSPSRLSANNQISQIAFVARAFEKAILEWAKLLGRWSGVPQASYASRMGMRVAFLDTTARFRSLVGILPAHELS
jgi:hypothetical protein